MVRECLVYLTIALVVIGCAHLAKPKTPQLEMSQLEHEVDARRGSRKFQRTRGTRSRNASPKI
jgi:hypothetical protein